MSKKDKVAFLISSIVLLVGLLPMLDGEVAGLMLWVPVLLYWVYRYFNKDISFIGRHNGTGKQ